MEYRLPIYILIYGLGTKKSYGRGSVSDLDINFQHRIYLQYMFYSFAFGLSCLSIASATIRLWILPVAVFGILSVK